MTETFLSHGKSILTSPQFIQVKRSSYLHLSGPIVLLVPVLTLLVSGLLSNLIPTNCKMVIHPNCKLVFSVFSSSHCRKSPVLLMSYLGFARK